MTRQVGGFRFATLTDRPAAPGVRLVFGLILDLVTLPFRPHTAPAGLTGAALSISRAPWIPSGSRSARRRRRRSARARQGGRPTRQEGGRRAVALPQARAGL